MITVKDRRLLVPIEDSTIGYTGDNKVEIRTFEITESALFNFDFQLDLRNDKNVIIGRVPLIKTVRVDKITLTWEVLEEHLTSKGRISIQLNAFTDADLKWNSKITTVSVGESIGATSVIDPIAETEFAIQEQRIVALKNETQSARDTTITKASEVAGNTITVENNKNIVVQLADSISDDVDLILSKVAIAENAADTSTAQAEIATDKAEIATTQANLAIDNAAITTNDKNTVVAKAIEVESNKDIVVDKASEVSDNTLTVASNTNTVVEKASQVDIDASQVANDKLTVAGYKSEVESDLQTVSDKTDIVVEKEAIVSENTIIVLAKALEASENAEQVALDKITVASDKAIVVADTNAVSVDKDTVVSAKQATELLKSDVVTLKDDTEEIYSDCLGILNQQTSLLATTPTWYVKDTINAMNAITTMKDSDFCILISSELESQSLYRYFTKDISGVDLVIPAWVWISDLSLLQLTQSYLLSILQLPTVATSGSYPDLINKPNRYESFITVTNGIWDYALSDKIILTTNNLSSIINVQNGAIGIINTSYDLTLPADSKKAIDYDYIIATAGQSYTYTFLYNGVNYYWSRVVVI